MTGMKEERKNKGNVPNLRFPEFEGEWEVTFLGNECTVNPKVSTLESEFVYVDLESVVKGVLISTNHINRSEAPSRAQRVLSDKDILFQCVRPYQLNNYIYHRQGSKQWVASTGYAQIRTKHNIDFLYQLLNSPQFNQEVMLRCTGTSYPAISGTDLGNIPISICSNEEQKKIGGLLFRIDDQIATQSKIIEGLKELKAWLSKQLFSRKLRFKDDDGADFPEWKTQLLGNVTMVVSERNKNNEKLPVYSINNKDGFVPQNEQFEGIDSDDRGYDIKLYKVINKHTFAYNPARINVGSIGYSGNLENIIISSLYVCFKTQDSINDNFLFHFFKTNSFNKEVLKNVEGGVRDYLFYENFSKIRFEQPCMEEQGKITDFLSSYDYKIRIESKVLQQLEIQKKYLLKQMFI